MRVLPGPTRSNQVLAWSPDGRFVVAAGTGDGVMVWDVNAGTPGRRIIFTGRGGRFVQFCPRTGRMYAGFQSGGCLQRTLDTDEERWVPWEHSHVSCNGLTVSADGRKVVVDCGHTKAGYSVADNGALTTDWSYPNNSGARAAFVFRRGSEELFGLNTHTSPRRFEWIVPNSGALIGSLPVGRGWHVTQWVLAPDGDRVAWLSNQALFVQRLDESEPRTVPAVAGEFRRGVAWSPDGRALAYAAGRTVRFIDPDTMSELRAFDWNVGKVRAVAFSPDGLRAAVSGDAGKGWVTVFDLE